MEKDLLTLLNQEELKMSNRNFNKQVVPARTKLAAGGKAKTLTDPSDMRPFPKTSKPITRSMKKGKRKVILSSEERRKKNIIKKYANSDLEMPIALQKSIRGNKSTPPASKSKEIKLDYQQPLPRDYPKKQGRKKLMGGGSSSSREAMMHGFYNKDMGMGKKKK